MSRCESCGAGPATYRITEEDGHRVYLCADCREDVEYCVRGGKPEPEADGPEPDEGDEGHNLWERILDAARTKEAYRVEVIADDFCAWNGNGLTFDTVEAAEDYAQDLYSRWTAVREWQVVDFQGLMVRRS